MLLYVNGLKAENISKRLQTSLLRNVNIYAKEKWWNLFKKSFSHDRNFFWLKI